MKKTPTHPPKKKSEGRKFMVANGGKGERFFLFFLLHPEAKMKVVLSCPMYNVVAPTTKGGMRNGSSVGYTVHILQAPPLVLSGRSPTARCFLLVW